LEQPGSDHLLGYRQLAEGTHEIVLEYYESGGGAMAQFSFGPSDEPPPPVTPFTAEFFANRDLAGSPVVTRMDERIDFQWGGAAPDPALPNDSFSARWTRTTTYEAGTYRFTVTGDDGIRVRVDGDVVVNGWFYQARRRTRPTSRSQRANTPSWWSTSTHRRRNGRVLRGPPMTGSPVQRALTEGQQT
jgi:hypothetical protein